MDRLDAMQAFARVVETGGFAKAADTLHISEAAVIEVVELLEARLRVKLLDRTAPAVNVTEDGAAYYERVLQILSDIEDAETSLSNAAAAPRGRLRVDVPSPFASTILIPALPAFHARYPDIQLHVGVSDRSVDLIDEGVDCVMRGGEVSSESLVVRHIGSLPLGVYASPDYLAREGSPAHPGGLEALPHKVIGYFLSRARRVFPCAMSRGDERIDVQGHYSLVVDDGNAYIAAGVAGLGVLWLPAYIARSHVERGELVELFTDWQLAPMPLSIVFPPNRHVSAKLRVFIDWVVELMAEHAARPAAQASR